MDKGPETWDPRTTLKIFCRNGKTENKLILGNGRIDILGPMLVVYKEIRTLLACKRCQSY